MKNRTAYTIYENASILKGLEGFELAKAIVLNTKKIEKELVEVLRTMIEGKKDPTKIIEEVLDKDCTIEFHTIREESLPKNITVEQYSLLSNWII